MSKATDFLSGTKVLAEVTSPINGEIKVVKTLVFGTYIQVEGLTQSGGVMYSVWNTVLKKAKKEVDMLRNALILGLGGGDAARLIKKYWPEAKITGIEIDPEMVKLGQKYLGLDESKVTIKIQDAKDFVKSQVKAKKKYDLILIDVYVGYEVPEKFTEKEFIKQILKLTDKDGLVIFNRLYLGDKRKLAEIFHRELIKVFKKVRPIYPEANVMYLCSN